MILTKKSFLQSLKVNTWNLLQAVNIEGTCLSSLLKVDPIRKLKVMTFTPGMLWYELMWGRPCHKICIYYSQQWERKEMHAS